jgi:hypothetical protein
MLDLFKTVGPVISTKRAVAVCPLFLVLLLPFRNYLEIFRYYHTLAKYKNALV